VGPAVEAKGLYHIYREREVETVALRGAELTLHPASWTSIMGPSGSGKSTLLHVLARLLVEAAAEQGAAVVPVTHDPAVARHADRAVGLRSGRLEATDPGEPPPGGAR
jgi:ABC-type lipoprotein export system ATPase subunit